MIHLAVESSVSLRICEEDGKSSRPSLSFRSSFFCFLISLSLSYHASARCHILLILQASFSILEALPKPQAASAQSSLHASSRQNETVLSLEHILKASSPLGTLYATLMNKIDFSESPFVIS